MELRELLIDETQEHFGVEAISLVKSPAIEENFFYFESQKGGKVELAYDDDRQVVVGPALIPNKEIYRLDAEGNEFNVFFSPKTVQRCCHLFMRSSNTKAATLDHDRPAEGVYVLETWVVENPEKDKQAVYGFNFPAGTWMVSMKVEDKETWEGVKKGNFRGFSIEGYFVDRLVKSNTEMSKLEQLGAFVKDLFNETKEVKLYAEEALADGRKLATEAEAFEVGAPVVILDEEGNPVEAEPGEYELANGTKVTVGEGGILEAVGESEEKPEEKPEEEMEQEFSDAQIGKISEIVTAAVTKAVTEALAPTEENLSKAVKEFAQEVKKTTDGITGRVKAIEDAPAAKFSNVDTDKKDFKTQTLGDLARKIK